MISKPLMRHDAVDLSVCAQELAAIFQRTSVTGRDRETRSYQGYDMIAPMSTEFVNHDQYAADVYLADAAQNALKLAITTGILPLWVGDEVFPLDPQVIFAANKWKSGETIKSGRYLPLNVFSEAGDDVRSNYNGAVLWVRNEDWWTVRDRLFADRQREFESEATFDRHWRVHQAAAWLASRDSAAVNALAGRWNALQSLDPKFDGWMATWIALSDEVSARFCECGQRGLSCPTLNTAREALRAACERGDVRAYGQRSESTRREPIPPLEFHEAELWHGRGLILTREVGGKAARIWHELRFESEDVRSISEPVTSAPSSTFERWSEERMKAAIAACPIRNREQAWREIFEPMRKDHGWSNDDFRQIWSTARNTKGMIGRPMKRA